MTPLNQPSALGLEVIGQYRIVRALGHGGMGTVYLGQRLGDFAQTVAIKVFRPGIEERDSEAQILTSLDHPGIVRLLHRGRLADGAAYLVMEFVDGQSIDAYCEQRALDLIGRVQLLLQAAEIAAYAHSKLILHADLKLQNILVTTEGNIKLLDFGLARWLKYANFGPPYFSPGFSAPEQQFGQNLTVASDIFSLGKSGIALIGAHLISAPDLAAILYKASSPEPDNRYRSMRELAEDLRAWLEKRPVAAYRTGRLYSLQRWAQRNRLQAALALVLTLIVLASTIGVGIETLQAAQRRRLAELRLREVAALTGKLQGDLYLSLPAGESADTARHKLLSAAANALEKMQHDDNQDAALRQEIALQYKRLAQLQQANGDAHGAALSEAAADRLASPLSNPR